MSATTVVGLDIATRCGWCRFDGSTFTTGVLDCSPASKAEPELVVGDGVHTIAQLVEATNADPRRGENWSDLLGKIEINAAAKEVVFIAPV